MKTKTELLELVDRVTDERDALQVLLTAADEENDALKHWRDLALQFDNHRMKALWHLKTLVSDGAHYEAAAAFLAEPPVPASELQQRLTAADERADVLEGLLREVQKSARKQDWASGYPTLFASVDAALKPAECCTVSAEDQALLDAGDYTPEELFGVGGKPSCPKCAP